MFDGVVELAADFTQEADTTMVFELGQGIEDSKLKLTGALTLGTGTEAEITIAGGILADSYTLIETTGGITDSFASLIFPDLATFGFSTAIVGDDFVLTVARVSTFGAFARSSSEERVAQYLEDSIPIAGSGSLSLTLEALERLNAREFATALGQLNPESYDAHTSSILSWGRLQQQMLQQRPMRCDRFHYAVRSEIVSDSPCGSRGLMPWAKLVGKLGRHQGGEPSGYDSLGGGVLVGVDYRWGEQLWLSGDIGFARVEVEHDNGAEGDFDSVDLGVAAGMVRGALSVRSSLTYSHGFHQATRDIDFLGDRVESKFDSDRVSLAVGTGYRFQLGHFILEPNATADYSHVAEESLKEKGNDEVALDLSSRKTDVFATTAGFRLSTQMLKYRFAGEFLEWADGVWSPVVSVQWRQAFGDVDRDQKAEMRGAPDALGSFKSKASDSNGGLELGGHVTFQPLKTATTIEVGYDGYFGDDVTNHALSATVRVPF